MLQRLVRVILSANVDRFRRSINSAGSVFNAFVATVTGGVKIASFALMGLQAGLSLLRGAFGLLQRAAKGFWDLFVESGLKAEQWRITMQTVIGETGNVAEAMDMVNGLIRQYGLDTEQARDASKQMAMALRGMTGEVNTEDLERLMLMIAEIKAVRDDIPGGAATIGRGIAAALAGDFTTLTRLLDLPITKLQGLSEETRRFIEGATTAEEQQLGKVTRLGEQAGAQAGDAIKALEEILAAAGITEDVLEGLRGTTKGQLDILKANWQLFTEDVSNTFLPHLNTALEKLIDFVEENRPALEKFAEKLGELAGTGLDNLMEFLESDAAAEGFEALKEAAKNLYDIITSPEFSKSVKNIADKFGQMGEDTFTGLVDVLQGTDWEEIHDTMVELARAAEAVADILPSQEKREERQQRREERRAGRESAAETMSPSETAKSVREGIEAMGSEDYGFTPTETMSFSEMIQDFKEGIQEWREIMSGGIGVEVSASEDFDIRVEKKAAEEASKQMSDLVDETTRGGKQKASSQIGH